MLHALLIALLPGAQAGELVSLRLKSIAPVEYRSPEPVTAEVNSIDLQAAIPVPVREGTYLIPGLRYRLEAPRFIDPPADFLPVPFLHLGQASLGAAQVVGRWSVLGRLSGGLAGDLEAIDPGVVRIEALALAKRTVSDTLELGGGATMTYAFGQLLPIPLLQIRWQPSDVFTLEGVLPANLQATWRPRPRLRVGGFAEIVGNEYAIRLDDIRQQPPCTGEDADASECLDHIAYTDGDAGVLFGGELGGGLWLGGRVGYSFYRRFSLLSADDEPISGGDQRLQPAPFGELTLSWEY